MKLRFRFADLRIHIANFRNILSTGSDAADHVMKFDLNSKSKMAAMIMTWLSQGIPHIIIRESRCLQIILNTLI